MENCLFCKFAQHTLPKDFTYEDDDVMVFPDIHPLKPIHLLVMPKKHVADFLDLTDDDLLLKIQKVIQKMVHDNKLEKRGYRLVVNGGGAQIIPHLHFHLVGPVGKEAQM